MLMIYVRKYNYIIMLSYVFFLFSFPALSLPPSLSLSLSLFNRRSLIAKEIYFIIFTYFISTRCRHEETRGEFRSAIDLTLK